ncbi:MAG: hypothetical protein ACFFCI_00595 [Promethearchaeota archaeon]
MPFGKCIHCINWIKSDPDPKQCTCAKKENYITLNALKRLFCESYVPKNQITHAGHTFTKTGENLLELVVCTTALNAKLVVETINKFWPSGTNSGWILAEGETLDEIRKRQQDENLRKHLTNPIDCIELKNHKHWIFVC